MALAAIPAFAQSSLDKDALVKHGLEIASFKPRDAFSPPPEEGAFANRPFRIVTPYKESEAPRIAHLVGGWAYDQQTQKLRIAVSPSGWQKADYPQAEADTFMHYGIHVGGRSLSSQTYTAQNAFGAQVEVSAYTSQAVKVAALTRRERSASADIPSPMFVDISMAPDQARSAVAGAEMIVEGVLVPFAEGRITQCADTGSGATIDTPIASAIRTCVMNARITRVAIVTAKGDALAEWLPK